MRHRTTFFLGLFVFAALLAYMCTYVVRYDQTAVETTFGRAASDAVKTEPGIYFKAPAPFSQVTVYPRKAQLLEDELQQFQTADKKSVVIRSYVLWTIQDPFKFFKRLRTVEQAEDALREQAGNLTAVVSRFRFDELVNVDPEAVKLDEIQAAITDQLEANIASQDYGIEILRVGIRRLVLPESVTENVYAAMRSNREAEAANARQEGESRARQITSEAESTRDRILAFANTTAEAIRTEGRRDQAAQFSEFAADEDFAIFLRRMQVLPQILGNNSTFVLPAGDALLRDLFNTTGDDSASKADDAPVLAD